MKTLLVTVSDDRFGRKGSKYAITQDKMMHIFKSNAQFGITDFMMLKWDDIVASDFYQDNKTLLDNTDPSRNGRAYKPWAILMGLLSLNDGDFLIYNDCSPEIWNMAAEFKISERYTLDIAHQLCRNNNGVLTVFVKWSDVDFKGDELGIHTHANFTTDRCMNKMGLLKYRNSYQHASGMWIIERSTATIGLISEWLHWNCIDECAGLGWATGGDDVFWNDELGKKMGHRHDQSISGLLINKIGNKLVDIPAPPDDMHPYNFLQYCRKDIAYRFYECNVNE